MALSSDQLPMLQTFPGFARLNAEELAFAGEFFEFLVIPAGKDLYRQDEPGKFFYLIWAGAIRITRRGYLPQTVHAGDLLGEEALLRHKRRGTAHVESDVSVLRAAVGDLRILAREIPLLLQVLRAIANGRRLASPARFRWLTPDEIVYLASRKTEALLIPSLLLPIVLMLISIGSAVVFLWLGLASAWLVFSAAGILISIGWGGWQTVDWSNDYYLVTNRRAVVIQRVPFIYDDRQETPLAMIQSVSYSRSFTQRLMGCGDVSLRTFTKPLVFPSMPNPALAAQLIEEIWKRELSRQAPNEREEIEAVLEGRIHPEDIVPETQDADSVESSLSAIGRTQTRFEHAGVVTYRKHFFFIIRNTFLPALLSATGIGLALFAGVGVFPIERIAGMGIGVVVGMLGMFWGWYEYLDWANDLYQVTPDQIQAVHRKPLGDEERRTAALENILSLEYDRPGLLARLLNFGTVSATVGQVKFSFDQVQDPVGVQDDIFRRMERKRQRRAAGQRQERREEIATWIETYHRITHTDTPPTEEKK